MAPRKSRGDAPAATVEIRTKTSENEPENEPEKSVEEADLENLIASMPQGTIAKLYRVEPDGNQAWLENTPPNEMSEERAAKHGPGKYRILLWGPHPSTKKMGYRGSATLVIGRSAAADAIEAARRDASPNVPVPGMSMTDQLAGGMFMNMIRQQQEMSAAQSRMQMEHSAAMMTLMSKLAERPATDPLISALLPEIIRGRGDPFEIATRMAELAAKQGGPKSTMQDVLGVMELIDKVKSEAGGGDGGSSNWMDMLKTALPLILRRGGGDPAPPPVATVPAPPPNAPQLGGPPNVAPTTPVDDSTAYLSPFLPFLPRIEEAAIAGMDAELAAEFFLGLVPPGHWPILGGILDRPSVVSDIVKVYGRLAPFEAWLGLLRAAMAKEIRGGEGAEDGEIPTG